MEKYFQEYIGKNVIVSTDKGIITGILEDGLKEITYRGIFLPNSYNYFIKISDVWYKIRKDGIMQYDNKRIKTY